MYIPSFQSFSGDWTFTVSSTNTNYILVSLDHTSNELKEFCTLQLHSSAFATPCVCIAAEDWSRLIDDHPLPHSRLLLPLSYTKAKYLQGLNI